MTDTATYSYGAAATTAEFHTDPDLDDVEGTGVDEPSDLDVLAGLVADAGALEPFRLSIPTRPNVVLEFRRDVSAAEIESWRKRCREGKRLNGAKLSRIVLASANTGIVVNGRAMTDEGERLTVRHAAALEALGAGTPGAALAALFRGQDGAIDAAGAAVLEASGWGGEVDPADPADPTDGAL